MVGQNSKPVDTLVEYSRYLLVVIKYLLLAILTLVIFVKPEYPVNIVWGSGLLLVCMSGLLMVGSVWGNSLLQSVIYFSGLISIFIIENYGRQTELAGGKVMWISHILFTCLFVAVGIKVVLRKRVGQLITSPFEYLILFVAVAVPLLPSDITVQFHLLSVAAKSVILFVAYKMILMRQTHKNRKIVFATFIALLALVLRYALKMQF